MHDWVPRLFYVRAELEQSMMGSCGVLTDFVNMVVRRFDYLSVAAVNYCEIVVALIGHRYLREKMYVDMFR